MSVKTFKTLLFGASLENKPIEGSTNCTFTKIYYCMKIKIIIVVKISTLSGFLGIKKICK